jgi:hypothetical protein
MFSIGDMVIRTRPNPTVIDPKEIGIVTRIKEYYEHNSYFVYWLNNDSDQLQYAYRESEIILVSKVK